MFSLTVLIAVAGAFARLASATPVAVALESRQNAGGSHTGDATYYAVGLGACGKTNKDSDFIVAVDHQFFDTFPCATANPNNNPICGLGVTASYQGRSIQVKIEDRCTGCGPNDLDFSTSAFQALIGPLSIGRAHGMTWKINSLPACGSGNGSSSCPQKYTAVAGDTCDAIDKKYGISLSQFLSMNPSVNSQCTNLQIGVVYCV